jgi:hypothetical protein
MMANWRQTPVELDRQERLLMWLSVVQSNQSRLGQPRRFG